MNRRLLLASGGSTAPPPDPDPNLDPGTWTRRLQVTDATATVRDTYNGSHATRDITGRARLTIGAPARALRTTWNALVGDTYTIKASLEVNGDLHPLTTSSGQRVVTVPALGHGTLHAPADLVIYPDDEVYLRVAPTGTSIPCQSWSAHAPWGTASGDATDTPGWTNLGTGLYHLYPVEVSGLTPPNIRSLALVGDSITEGGYDNQGGWANRAGAAAWWPRANYGHWAQTMAAILNPATGESTPYWTRQTTADDALTRHTHVVTAYGTNDIVTLDVDTLRARYLQFWAWVGGGVRAVAQRTIPPRTTSTDGWTTLAGQTTTEHEPDRVAINAWLRDGAPDLEGRRAGQAGHPLTAVIDSAAQVEASGGVWRVDLGVPADDGVHPSPTIHALMAAPLTAWLNNVP